MSDAIMLTKFPTAMKFMENEIQGNAMRAAYTAVREELNRVNPNAAAKNEAIAARVALKVRKTLNGG